MTTEPFADIHSLRATVRDLLALSTIPETWVGREPHAIAADLADLLIGSLDLDFVFVRLCDPAGGQLSEVARGNSWRTFPEWLKEHLAAFGQISRKEIVTNVGGLDEFCRGIVIPIGVNSERGFVAVASDRPGFPDQIDQQLLSVAANSAATAFQNAFLIDELRSAQQALRANEQELRKARDELEIKVTERTSELRRSERELRDVIDTIPAIAWSALPDGSNSYINSRFVKYCGTLPEQIADSGWHAATHPDDLERHNAKWLACAASGEPFEDEVRFRRADGQFRWHLQRAVPLRDEAGNVAKWFGVLTDIEDRKRAENKIREQETELRQMLDFAPQLIAVYGPNRERLYANRVALDYAGLSIDEWRQTEARGAFIHPEDREQELAYFARAQSDSSAGQLELRLRGSDGSYRWFLARYNSVRDEDGQILRWHVSCTDIEDRKRAEEKLRQENVALREEIDRASMFEEIVGTSPALQSVLSRISKVAPTDSTVLITGETGTGKELVARAIHRRSNRASRAFVGVNCAAIPRDLIASELFGHEKGAFTGAVQRRIGRFELAEGGTIFLDEVGELSAETQIALLRVLQEREIERVGGRQTIHVDVRVIAATNRNLKASVESGNFRDDLYYRLNVFPLDVPPLRERRDDISLLVRYFIDRYARKAGKNITSIDKKTLRLLESYPWPGNIRELQNVIERSVIVSETENFSIDECWLSQQSHERSGVKLHLSQKLATKEKEVIEEALRESHGRVFGPTGAAAKLGIARSTLESKIQALNINKARFKVKPRS
jgi:formate hydrogenlyase transcriptional activator